MQGFCVKKGFCTKNLTFILLCTLAFLVPIWMYKKTIEGMRGWNEGFEGVEGIVKTDKSNDNVIKKQKDYLNQLNNAQITGIPDAHQTEHSQVYPYAPHTVPSEASHTHNTNAQQLQPMDINVNVNVMHDISKNVHQKLQLGALL
jgi:hypothetical protein